jgi:hypothetical protein
MIYEHSFPNRFVARCARCGIPVLELNRLARERDESGFAVMFTAQNKLHRDDYVNRVHLYTRFMRKIKGCISDEAVIIKDIIE